jgi:type IV secretion system protein VirB9
VYRLTVKALPVKSIAALRPAAPDASLLAALSMSALPVVPAPASSQEVVAERLQTKAQVLNSSYSIAEGQGSEDILPSLVFDDGRFTYFRFAGNREVPAVFAVLGDGSETLVNTRMEDELLVVDRVSRRLMLRAGNAVVGVWNEAFDLNGQPPEGGTTVNGVRRVFKTEQLSKAKL